MNFGFDQARGESSRTRLQMAPVSKNLPPAGAHAGLHRGAAALLRRSDARLSGGGFEPRFAASSSRRSVAFHESCAHVVQ